MKLHAEQFLVVSRPYYITQKSNTQLNIGQVLPRVSVSKRKIDSVVCGDGIHHYLIGFPRLVPTYVTKFEETNEGVRFQIYHTVLNRIFFIPVQALLVLNAIMLLFAFLGSAFGIFPLALAELVKMAVLASAFLIMLIAYFFLMKFVGQFFARKTFQELSNNISQWFTAP